MTTDPTDLPLLPPGAHWQQIPGLLDQDATKIQARVDAAQGGHWHLAPERHMPPGTVRTNIDGYNRTIGRLERFTDADRDLILYAHADLTFLLAERARLKAELAESTGRTAALAEAAAAVINVQGPLIHRDSVYAAYDAVRRIDEPGAPSIHDEERDLSPLEIRAKEVAEINARRQGLWSAVTRQILNEEAAERAREPRECRTCAAPADAAGRIEHRPGTPCTTDYSAI